MEDKDNLALEANRILNELGISKALNEATLHEVIFGTSCILITKDGARAIEPYSDEWFNILRPEVKYGNLNEESRKLFNGEFIEGEVTNHFKIEE